MVRARTGVRGSPERAVGAGGAAGAAGTPEHARDGRLHLRAVQARPPDPPPGPRRGSCPCGPGSRPRPPPTRFEDAQWRSTGAAAGSSRTFSRASTSARLKVSAVTGIETYRSPCASTTARSSGSPSFSGRRFTTVRKPISSRPARASGVGCPAARESGVEQPVGRDGGRVDGFAARRRSRRPRRGPPPGRAGGLHSSLLAPGPRARADSIYPAVSRPVHGGGPSGPLARRTGSGILGAEGGARAQVHHHGSPGQREGDAGEDAGEGLRPRPHQRGRHLPLARPEPDEARHQGPALHEGGPARPRRDGLGRRQVAARHPRLAARVRARRLPAQRAPRPSSSSRTTTSTR